MKFTDLSVTDVSDVPERISFDGYTLKVGANEIPLSGQWVDIVGIESKQFKEMKLRMQREALTAETVKTAEEIDCLIKSSLIVDWSFDEPCNEENKVAALKVWPSTIVNYCVKRAEGRVDLNFTKSKSQNS